MSAVPEYLDNVAQLRMPPHSVPAEQSVIGALLLAPEALKQVRDQSAEDAVLLGRWSSLNATE
ncbi:DnaB-like helicase N-terminal domain-containing protein [Stenotrophomonas sp. LGBM10]|uniref:DnaB-like helicase N-terminal domain-containing protein n=1 Tax=Stenotrophomonas sp. LGBM10 TaxID=3390038 RepID=UPI00398B6A02